jgi:membrane protein
LKKKINKLREDLKHKFLVIDRFLGIKLRHISFPGFQKKSIYEVVRFFIKSMFVDDINLRASSMAFNFFVAIFPTIIFCFTLIAFIPIANFDETLLSFIEQFLPPTSFVFLTEIITDILRNQNSGLLSFGFFAALYFATNAIAGMIEAFDSKLEFKQQRNWFNIRYQSIYITFMLFFLIVVTIGLSLGLDYLIGQLTEIENLSRWVPKLAKMLNYTLVFLFVYIIFSFLYYFGSSKISHWKFFSPGSTVATILCILTTYGFKSYVVNFNSYNQLYGSIGAVIVILLVFYLNSIVILIGYELNRSIDKARLEVPRNSRTQGPK